MTSGDLIGSVRVFSFFFFFCVFETQSSIIKLLTVFEKPSTSSVTPSLVWDEVGIYDSVSEKRTTVK